MSPKKVVRIVIISPVMIPILLIVSPFIWLISSEDKSYIDTLEEVWEIYQEMIGGI